MKTTCGPLTAFEARQPIVTRDAAEVFAAVRQAHPAPAFLFESRSVNPLYGRMSLMGFDPVLEIKGYAETIAFTVLNDRGNPFLEEFSLLVNENGGVETIEHTNKKLVLKIPVDRSFLSEDQRSRRQNIVTALHRFLERFRCTQKSSLGIYGAFSYDFARLFEDLPATLPERPEIADLHFYLFDSFLRFDLIKEQSEALCYRPDQNEAETAASALAALADAAPPAEAGFVVGNVDCDTDQADYEALVEAARDLAKRGELFEVVFSRNFSGSFSGDPFAVYRIYREKNPAPYLFFFDFQQSQLVGASPEMMVRVENNKAHLRPISGTRPRGADPISDHENMLDLLANEKERAELDMLIDLGRNDLKRVCLPGIEITAYRVVERYSRVMHTIAHLTGRLRPECTALDALIACQSAGTLTGAPKVQAMIEIEKHEKSRRGYYGGSIGYLTFAGDMDTGIIIRSAHIQNGKFEFRVGATLLYDSDPHAEFLETENKAKALLDILKGEE